MNSHLPCIHLAPCPKGYTRDLDKTMSPPQTIARVKQRLAEADLDILAHTTRVDVNRLGIPVFLSVCGADARRVMPTRKQMGKGSSPEPVSYTHLDVYKRQRSASCDLLRDVQPAPCGRSP